MSPTVLLVGIASALPAATQDNNVQWDGVTHFTWLDRVPQAPVSAEPFDVRFQTFHDDITSARVRIDDGSLNFVDAEITEQRGPYDIWTATVPGGVNVFNYMIELTDGSDTDYFSVSGMNETLPGDGGFVIDHTTLSHVPLGTHPVTGGGAVFRVWAPNATTATLRGEMNAWGETTMNNDGDFWSLIDPTAQIGDEYKFFFNESIWKPDARARAWTPSFNNAQIVDRLEYDWGDDGFSPPPFEDMVIYELHVGTFSGKNDGLGDRMGLYRDVVDTHLDHLVNLGINVVELMPVSEFSGFNSWGYNPTNHYGVEDSYGSPDDLKYMIDTLHQAGIAVLIDVVYNHFSPDNNELWCYDGSQIYFDGNCTTGVVDTPWGAQADFDNPQVREYFADNLIYWLDEYHFDGIRMDATRFMRDNGTFPAGQPSGWSLMQQLTDNMNRRAIDKIAIAEELPDGTAITNPTSIGGAGFDSQWHDFYVDTVRQQTAEAAFGDPDMSQIANAINDAAYPAKTNLVRYVESHDEAGNEDRLPVVFDSGNPQSEFAIGRSMFAQGLTLMTPGIPMMFQGGEWIEETKFDSQFEQRLDWNKATDRAEIVQFFQDIIRVRRSNCALRSNGGFSVYHIDDTQNVIALQRFDLSGNQIVVVGSLNNNDLTNQRVGFPASGTWYEILNSQSAAYGGNDTGNGGQITTEAVAWDGMAQSAEITVPRMSIVVFRHENPFGRSTDLNGDTRTDLFDYFILQQRAGQQGCGMSADFNEDGRVARQDLAELVANITGP